MVDKDLLLENLGRIATDPDQALARHLLVAATSEVLTSGRLPLTPPSHFWRAATVDPAPFLAELHRLSADHWDQSSRHKISVQRETRSIELCARANRQIAARHDQFVRRRHNAGKFPHLIGWLENFAATTGNGTLQIVRIVKLRGLGQVYPHIDRGLYYLIRDRYHLVLKSPSGSRMQCEGQVATWHAGEVWWFNNHVVHQSFNDSDDERIHVIFDVLPRRCGNLVAHFQKCAETLEIDGG